LLLVAAQVEVHRPTLAVEEVPVALFRARLLLQLGLLIRLLSVPVLVLELQMAGLLLLFLLQQRM
jgi:hypothetical protein